MYALLIAGLGIFVENETTTLLDAGTATRHFGNAQLRPLQIDQDADRPGIVVLDLTDRIMDFSEIIMRRMAHIDPKNISACIKQALYGFGI